MITFITRETFDHLQRAIPGLQRAVSKTSLGESWDIPSLADHIANYAAYAFLQEESGYAGAFTISQTCLLYTSPSPRDRQKSRMPSSA